MKSSMTPQEIVSELDRHIVGQGGAKRAVAIALRNRWRRQQVEESMRAEITPKNILMTELKADYKALADYRPAHKVRFVTAAALFDGHDAAINIMSPSGGLMTTVDICITWSPVKSVFSSSSR